LGGGTETEGLSGIEILESQVNLTDMMEGMQDISSLKLPPIEENVDVDVIETNDCAAIPSLSANVPEFHIPVIDLGTSTLSKEVPLELVTVSKRSRVPVLDLMQSRLMRKYGELKVQPPPIPGRCIANQGSAIESDTTLVEFPMKVQSLSVSESEGRLPEDEFSLSPREWRHRLAEREGRASWRFPKSFRSKKAKKGT
jgi:hypothetical protein